MFGVRPVRQFLSLLGQHALSSLILELLFDLRLDLVERRRLWWLNLRYLINRVTHRSGSRCGRIILLGPEQGVHKVRSASDAGKLIGLRNHTRRCDCEILVFRGFIHSLGASQGLNRVGNALRLGRGLLLLQDRLDFHLYFFQRLEPSLLLCLDTNNVEAIAGADDAGGLSDRRIEGSLLELRNRPPTGDRRQQTTVLGAARIFGILLPQIGKVCATLQLFRDVVSFSAGGIDGFLVYLAIGVRGRRLDQDVADSDGFRQAIVVLVLAVVFLQLIRSNVDRFSELLSIDQDVLGVDFLGNRVHVHLLVLVVIRFELGIRRIDLLLDVIQREDSVVELDLRVLGFKLRGNFLVADRDRSANGGNQLLLCNLSLNFLLEVLHADVELALDELLIRLLADEVAVGEQQLAELTLVQIIPQLVVAHRQAHPVRFEGDRLGGDHTLGRLLHQIRHELGRNVSLKALFADEAGLLSHLGNSDFLVANFG